MHAQPPLTAGVFENLHRVPRVGVHGAHDEARRVGADGDEAEVEGPAEEADGGKGRAAGEVGVLFRPVVVAGGGGWDGAVTRVAGEVDGLGFWGRGGWCWLWLGGRGGDGPGGPEGGGAVEEAAGRDVLAWEAGYTCCDGCGGRVVLVVGGGDAGFGGCLGG